MPWLHILGYLVTDLWEFEGYTAILVLLISFLSHVVLFLSQVSLLHSREQRLNTSILDLTPCQCYQAFHLPRSHGKQQLKWKPSPALYIWNKNLNDKTCLMVINCTFKHYLNLFLFLCNGAVAQIKIKHKPVIWWQWNCPGHHAPHILPVTDLLMFLHVCEGAKYYVLSP